MPSPSKPAAVQKQVQQQQQQQQQQQKGSKGKGGKAGAGQDMSQWFNLFADLDPLSNPDAIGKTTKEEDKNCYS